MKFALTLTAASVLAFSSFASAEQELSMVEMDIVSAGGSAAADAVADALGVATSTSTLTQATVDAQVSIPGQKGAIFDIRSTSVAAAEAAADAMALASSQGANVSQGSLLAETTATTSASVDTLAALPFATTTHTTTGIAQSILRGVGSSSSGVSSSVAALANALP